MSTASGDSRAIASTNALGDAPNFPVPEGLGIDRRLDIPLYLKAHLTSDVPALFISGTHDGRVPLESQRPTIGGFRHARQIVVERGGHNIFEQSTKVQDAVVQFLMDGTIKSARIELN